MVSTLTLGFDYKSPLSILIAAKFVHISSEINTSGNNRQHMTALWNKSDQFICGICELMTYAKSTIFQDDHFCASGKSTLSARVCLKCFIKYRKSAFYVMPNIHHLNTKCVIKQIAKFSVVCLMLWDTQLKILKRYWNTAVQRGKLTASDVMCQWNCQQRCFCQCSATRGQQSCALHTHSSSQSTLANRSENKATATEAFFQQVKH